MAEPKRVSQFVEQNAVQIHGAIPRFRLVEVEIARVGSGNYRLKLDRAQPRWRH